MIDYYIADLVWALVPPQRDEQVLILLAKEELTLEKLLSSFGPERKLRIELMELLEKKIADRERRRELHAKLFGGSGLPFFY